MSRMDDLLQSIRDTHRQRVEDITQHEEAIKTHQEAREAARDDVARLEQAMVVLRPPEGSHAVQEAFSIFEAVSRLEVPHTIDVGALAQALPKPNPFAGRADTLRIALWEIMHDGRPWRLSLLQPVLKAQGEIWADATIRKVLRQESTVFEGHEGVYRVTAAYRTPPHPVEGGHEPA